MKKKRLTAVLLALVLLAGLFPAESRPFLNRPKAVQAAEKEGTVENTMLLTGILGDFTADTITYSKKITRKEFAKMLVKASVYADQADKVTATSLYKDVTYKSAYAGYIKLAVEHNLMSAYVDGMFRPNRAVTLQEAAKAVIALLGYQSSDFSGSLNAAVLSKFYSLNLDKNISKTKTEALNRKDCMNLFYNLLNTNTKEGKLYGTLLGYPEANQKISYLELLKSKLKGPLLAGDDWQSELLLNWESVAVYRNESKSKLKNIQKYDVLYYSEAINTLWAYDNKVIGSLDAVSPDRLNPQTVTVENIEYKLSGNDIIYDFSSLGEYSLKDTLTLFLGLNGEAVFVGSADEFLTEVYGVVLETYKQVSTDTSESELFQNIARVVDVEGTEKEYRYDPETLELSAGDVVYIAYENDKQVITKLDFDKTALANQTVNADGTKVGNYSFAPDAEILDTYLASYRTMEASELKGVRLYGLNIKYYEFNTAGQISKLILNNVSGGQYTYGIVTAVSPNAYAPQSYTYLLDGKTKTIAADKVYGTPPAGSVCAFLEYDNGMIYMTPLTGSTVTSIASGSVKTVSWTRELSENAVVYYTDSDGVYYQTTVDKIKDTGKYSLTAYVDGGLSTVYEVKVILAKSKQK